MKKYLTLLIGLISFGLFGQVEPQQLQGSPHYKGILQAVSLQVDEFGDTTYLYQHVDSLHLNGGGSGNDSTKIKGKGLPTRVAWWAGTDSLSYDSVFYWDTLNKILTINSIPYASYATSQVAIGGGAGLTATSATDSNFFGYNAGRGATSATYSNFFGYNAGNGATSALRSNFFGTNAGYGATGANNSNFFGNAAGYNGSGASTSNFFGAAAGNGATNASSSNFFGTNAGYGATGASNSNFFGNGAGNGASNAQHSNFFGLSAGLNATDLAYTNAFGNNAGRDATFASYSNFFGVQAGRGATNAAGSVFIGMNAGLTATDASYSTLIGFRPGMSFTSNNIGSHNTIIGSNISLPNAATRMLNIGGVLFGTGLSNSTSGNPIITPISGGKIGIMTLTPSTTLHVAGDFTVDTRTGTPTKLSGFDANGKIMDVTVSTGLDLTSGTLSSTITQADGSETKINAGTNINVTGAGTSGSPYVINSTGGSGTVTSVAAGNGMNFSTITTSGSVSLGTPSTITLASTNSVSSNSHTHEFNPGGSAAQYIRGNGTLALFPTINSGTVTSIATNNGITGGTITTSGTIGLTGQASALHNLNTNGLIVRTGSGSVTTRSLVAGTGISITNGDGVSGNITITNTSTTPATWFDWGSHITNWAMNNTFNSGKPVGIGDQPTRHLDVNGDVRFRGAIYSSSNSAGLAGQVLTSNGSGAWSWQTPSGGATNLSYSTKSGTDVYLESSTGSDVIIRDGIGTTVNRVASNVIKIDATGSPVYNGVRASGGVPYIQNYSTTGSAYGNGIEVQQGDGTVITYSTSTNGGSIKVEAEAASFAQLERTNSDYTNNSISGTEFKIDFDNGFGNKLTTNPSTDRITLPSIGEGHYRITYSLTYRINTSGSYVGGFNFYVKRNGSTLGYRSNTETRNHENGSDNLVTISRDFIFHLNDNDYLELFAQRVGSFSSATFKNAVFNIQRITNIIYP